MPVYLENRGVLVSGSPARHMYLIFVPEGSEGDYSQYQTIGGFPTTPATNGPWGLLEATYTGDFLAEITDANKSDAYPDNGQLPNPHEYAGIRAWAEDVRNAITIYTGADEAAVWAGLIDAAKDLGNQFSYKASQVFGGGLWGPATNSNSFITSTILHAEKELGVIFSEVVPNTPGVIAGAPGRKTWLGTSENDTMSAADARAQLADIEAIHGGKGADNLSSVGVSTDVIFVAGDDFDIDTVRGGNGDDKIVGYYNQSDLDQSDDLAGGGGNDHFYIIDPTLTLPGGIPDLELLPGTSGLDFTNGGIPSGSGGKIDGGTFGQDTLDYQFVGGPVHLLLDGQHIINIDEIYLTTANDFVAVSAVSDYSFVDGREGSNSFSIMDGPEGVFIGSEPGIFGRSYRLENFPVGSSMRLKNFENFELTEGDDEANFRLFEENGDEVTGGLRITAYAAGGNDTLEGSAAHDDLHGGDGSDTILGGDGADFIYENGAASPIGEDETAQEYVSRLLAYDSEGDDSIDAGAGSDIIYYSGGIDSIAGGEGNDIYLIADEARGTSDAVDNLTIVLQETADKPFGNDLILGTGNGVDRVLFEGISRADITVTYDYEATFLSTQVVEFTDLFLVEFELALKVDHYVTAGSIQITVNETGSSLTIEQVLGYQTEGFDWGGTSPFEASMYAPFLIELDDGYLDLAASLLDPMTNRYTFINSDHGGEEEDPPVSVGNSGAEGAQSGPTGPSSSDAPVSGPNGSTAFAALGAFEAERAIIERTIDGTVEDDVFYGSTGSEVMNAGDGDDQVFAGGGSDIIIGGAGADSLFGGSGTDTASYASATAAVGAYLDPDRFSFPSSFGDALGDTFDGIENLTGSDFDDKLYGDAGSNLIIGGIGDDTILGMGGFDTLAGGDGNDEITARDFVDDGVRYIADTKLFGGAGNDTIQSGSGSDRIFGGDGDDLIELSTSISSTPGNDTINGGAGFDTVHFFSGPVVIDLVAGTGRYVDTDETARMTNIEGVIGSGEDDLIIGNAGDNVLDGYGGDDTLIGGAGNDELYAGTYSFSDDASLYGGSGIDTAHVLWASEEVSYGVIEGGLEVGNLNGSGSYTIYDDVEFVQFSDTLSTYQNLVQGLITEFAVIDDFIRVEEGATVTLDLLANDLEFGGNEITIQTINGIAASAGSIFRLDSGATITIEIDGSLTFDQGGAYAWLDANESTFTEFTYTATDVTNVVREATSTLAIDGVDTEVNNIAIERDVYIAETNNGVADALVIGNFNVGQSILIINEQFIDPNDVPAGFNIEEYNGDTFITYGGDDNVILSDVALDTWQYAAANRTFGTSAGELINGTDGEDLIQAGAGNDTVRSGHGNDVIVGQDGVDRLSFTSGDNIAFGGADTDYLTAFGDGENLLYGGEGDDSLYSHDGDDKLSGGSGNDYLTGRDGDDVMLGGDGDDVMFGGGGQDSFDGGAGFDRIELYNDDIAGLSGGATVDLAAGWISWSGMYPVETLVSIEAVFGTDQDDTILGDDFDNELSGNAGNDIIRGRGGDDRLNSGGGSNSLYGDDGDDVLRDQSADDDQFFGGDGNDLFIRTLSFSGSDEIYGGAGSDTLDLSRINTALDVDLAIGELGTGPGSSNFSGIENIIGTNGDNKIWGDAANNVIDGGNGQDELYGGAGDDLILAGFGTDIFDGGEGVDTLDFSYTSAATSFDLEAGTLSFEGGELIETATAFENGIGGSGSDIFYGTDAANTFMANDGEDTLSGGAGDDALFGGGGADSIVGNAGNDEINGDEGNDVLKGYVGSDVLNGDDGDDRVLGGDDNDVVFGGAGKDTMFGGNGNDIMEGNTGRDELFGDAGNDRLKGHNSDDTLFGGAGHDTLLGGNGNDIVSGGAGDDRLLGGAHADFFEFRVGDDVDTIVDFQNNSDEIRLEAAFNASNLSNGAFLAQFGSIVNGNAVLDFGNGDTLIIEGVSTLGMIGNDLVFI